MKLKYKKIALALIAALVLGLLLAGSGAFTGTIAQADDDDNESERPIETFTLDGLYPAVEEVGESELKRSSKGLKMDLETEELIANGVYTIWWLVFPPGGGPGTADPTAIIWGDGFIADEDGDYEGTIKLPIIDCSVDPPPVPGAFCEGAFTNPFSAAVEAEFVYHGQADHPDFDPSWLLDFFTGDPDECDIDVGIGMDVCPLAQITFHETPGSSGDDDDDDDDD